MEKEVFVYADLDRVPYLVGHLWARVRKDKEGATLNMTTPGWEIPSASPSNPPCRWGQGRFMPGPMRRCSVPSEIRRQIAGAGR